MRIFHRIHRKKQAILQELYDEVRWRLLANSLASGTDNDGKLAQADLSYTKGLSKRLMNRLRRGRLFSSVYV